MFPQCVCVLYGCIGLMLAIVSFCDVDVAYDGGTFRTADSGVEIARLLHQFNRNRVAVRFAFYDSFPCTRK